MDFLLNSRNYFVACKECYTKEKRIAEMKAQGSNPQGPTIMCSKDCKSKHGYYKVYLPFDSE